MSSLDETPTRIPAPTATTTTDIIPTNNPTEPAKPMAQNHHLPESEQNHKGVAALSDPQPRPVTVTKRPSSLVVQNTGMAISSAVAGRFGGSQTGSDKPAQNEPTTMFYRSPVQGITRDSNKGNKTIGNTTQDGKKSKKKQQGKKDAQVYATPGEVQAKVALGRSDQPVGSDKKAMSPTSKTPTNIVSVQAAGDSAVHVKQTGLEPNTGMVITGGGGGSEDVQHGARPSPEATRSEEEKVDQQQQGSSFLGSLFPWGRKTETTPLIPPASSQSDTVPSRDDKVGAVSDDGVNPPSQGTGKSAGNVDSGIDIAPLNSSAVDVFHADFSPVHASTPMHRGGPFQNNSDDVDSNNTRNSSSASRNLSAAYAADAAKETSPGYPRPAESRQAVPSQTPSPGSAFRTINPPVATQQVQGKTAAPIASMRKRDLNKMPSTSLSGRSGRPGSRHPKADPLPGGTTTTIPSDVHTLMREKAKLEGQIESMQTETAAALQDRANLQSQVAALQVQLQSYSDGAEMAGAQRSAMATDLRYVYNSTDTQRCTRHTLSACIQPIMCLVCTVCILMYH